MNKVGLLPSDFGRMSTTDATSIRFGKTVSAAITLHPTLYLWHAHTVT